MSKEEKKIEVITAIYKVRLHCPKCAHDIRRPLMRTQGNFNFNLFISLFLFFYWYYVSFSSPIRRFGGRAG